MGIMWTIIIVQSVSILFLIFCVSRLLHYLKRYKMEENRYTLLFGFLNLPFIVVLYAVTILLFAIISIFYTYSLF